MRLPPDDLLKIRETRETKLGGYSPAYAEQLAGLIVGEHLGPGASSTDRRGFYFNEMGLKRVTKHSCNVCHVITYTDAERSLRLQTKQVDQDSPTGTNVYPSHA